MEDTWEKSELMMIIEYVGWWLLILMLWICPPTHFLQRLNQYFENVIAKISVVWLTALGFLNKLNCEILWQTGEIRWEKSCDYFIENYWNFFVLRQRCQKLLQSPAMTQETCSVCDIWKFIWLLNRIFHNYTDWTINKEDKRPDIIPKGLGDLSIWEF